MNWVAFFAEIQLTWDIFGEEDYAKIATYKIMAFVEKSSNVSSLEGWKKAGEVQGLALPMTCSISVVRINLEESFRQDSWEIKGFYLLAFLQILDDVGRSRYHFAIQAKDIHGRSTPFSDIATISCWSEQSAIVMSQVGLSAIQTSSFYHFFSLLTTETVINLMSAKPCTFNPDSLEF